MKTHLISGAGNTFHITWQSPILDIQSQQKWAQEICRVKPADGFIFLRPRSQGSENNHYAWGFYNNDGSPAEMCGNATRCVGYYVNNILDAKGSHIVLDTIAGPIHIDIINSDTFKVQMTPVIRLANNNYFFCDTGVPHIVIEVENFESYKEKKAECRQLRFDPQFQPRGTNVTLISFKDGYESLKAVSYERGVEDFTEACGTGAMAAAFYNLEKNLQKITRVQMPGGDLIMDLTNLNSPIMTGRAHLIGEFSYDTKT